MLRKSQYRDLEKFKKTKREQQKRYYRKTQNAPNKGQRWTSEEIEMIMAKDVSDKELSQRLGRSMRAILCKRHKIKYSNSKQIA